MGWDGKLAFINLFLNYIVLLSMMVDRNRLLRRALGLYALGTLNIEETIYKKYTLVESIRAKAHRLGPFAVEGR